MYYVILGRFWLWFSKLTLKETCTLSLAELGLAQQSSWTKQLRNLNFSYVLYALLFDNMRALTRAGTNLGYKI